MKVTAKTANMSDIVMNATTAIARAADVSDTVLHAAKAFVKSANPQGIVKNVVNATVKTVNMWDTVPNALACFVKIVNGRCGAKDVTSLYAQIVISSRIVNVVVIFIVKIAPVPARPSDGS